MTEKSAFFWRKNAETILCIFADLWRTQEALRNSRGAPAFPDLGPEVHVWPGEWWREPTLQEPDMALQRVRGPPTHPQGAAGGPTLPAVIVTPSQDTPGGWTVRPPGSDAIPEWMPVGNRNRGAPRTHAGSSTRTCESAGAWGLLVCSLYFLSIVLFSTSVPMINN